MDTLGIMQCCKIGALSSVSGGCQHEAHEAHAGCCGCMRGRSDSHGLGYEQGGGTPGVVCSGEALLQQNHAGVSQVE